MLFSSNIFLFFFLPLVLTGYYLIKKNSIRNIFLLISSLLFYAWGEPKFIFIMIVSIVFNHYAALFISKCKASSKNATIMVVLMLFFNLGILVIFKYANFFVDIVNYIFCINLAAKEIRLPIGISFFTFQALSYVIDVYRNPGIVQKNILNVGLYIFFFPQLIAGPIVRYTTIAEQISSRNENITDFSDGVCRFTQGLGKKILLANSLALVADKAFELNMLNDLTVSFAWLGIVAYTLQIYYDFSGYSDMAIGLGKMFGFHFLENFNYPYISKSVAEFWRRWHISLGSWFRDYVYIPLGGSQLEKLLVIRNLFVVWFFTGIWHGASINFVIWGLMYFVLLCFEKYILIEIEKFIPIHSAIKHIWTLLWVMFGWVIFRAENISLAIAYLKAMLGLSGNVLYTPLTVLYVNENMIILLLGIVFATPIIQIIRNRILNFIGESRLGRTIINIISVGIYSCVFVSCISYLAKGTYNPFIYFNF